MDHRDWREYRNSRLATSGKLLKFKDIICQVQRGVGMVICFPQFPLSGGGCVFMCSGQDWRSSAGVCWHRGTPHNYNFLLS